MERCELQIGVDLPHFRSRECGVIWSLHLGKLSPCVTPELHVKPVTKISGQPTG